MKNNAYQKPPCFKVNISVPFCCRHFAVEESEEQSNFTIFLWISLCRKTYVPLASGIFNGYSDEKTVKGDTNPTTILGPCDRNECHQQSPTNS